MTALTPAGALMQTLDGSVVHLDRPPTLGAITREALVAGLCNTNRFCGQVPGRQIPVALHSIWGADAIMYETGCVVSAAYFLLHDGHEAFKGDQSSPMKAALIARMGAMSPLAAAAFKRALAEMEDDLDAAIHAAEGLPWPVPEPYAARVREFDLAMLETERRRCLDRGLVNPPRWSGDDTPPRQVRIELIWPSADRLDLCLINRLDAFIPAARKALAGKPLTGPSPGDDAARLLRLARAT